ncbi:hypothetical protein [Ferrovibrio terrae]|uniref:hypothetical protein n=1 Tax=Ferrovibrio terrae TaxID=2594003 RepID=UPI0031383A5C
MNSNHTLTGIRDLFSGKAPASATMRVSVDTDGKVFLCRIPELSLSAHGKTAEEAHAQLAKQIAEIDSMLGEGDSPIAKVARIQRVEGLNRRLRKTSFVLLGLSLLFFAVTITVVPLLDVKSALFSTASNTLHNGIGKLADVLTRMDPERKKKLAEDIGTIRQFIDEMLADRKPQ